MQWETATPVGFPMCMRHNDCLVVGLESPNSQELSRVLVNISSQPPPQKEVIKSLPCTPKGTVSLPGRVDTRKVRVEMHSTHDGGPAALPEQWPELRRT